jgi:hypothetical protein
MAYMFVLGATLGCLALMMIHHLSGGAWGGLISKPMGAATRVMPALTLLFLPIALGMFRLYVWTDPDVVAADRVLQSKRAYLNPTFFLVRAGLYFLAWNAASFYLNRLSLQRDRMADPQVARRMQRGSAIGLIVYAVTVTFASFDWMMSLEPHWFSTIYGVLIMGGHGVTALAVLLIALVWLSRRPPLNAIVQRLHFQDLANLMLAFIMLWAYFAYSQYLIIWSGNLPEEIDWYLRRLQPGWLQVAGLLVLVHFFMPFLLLLSRRIKWEPDLIVKVAAGVLAARVIELFWLIAPELHQTGLYVSWLDVILPLALGSLWVGFFIRELRRRSILPDLQPEFGGTAQTFIAQTEHS